MAFELNFQLIYFVDVLESGVLQSSENGRSKLSKQKKFQARKDSHIQNSNFKQIFLKFQLSKNKNKTQAELIEFLELKSGKRL